MDENLEIEKALKEFEAKEQQEQVVKTKVESKASEDPQMVKWVMKLSGGVIKEQKQAEYVLLAFTIIFFLISFYLFFGDSIARKFSTPPPSNTFSDPDL